MSEGRVCGKFVTGIFQISSKFLGNCLNLAVCQASGALAVLVTIVTIYFDFPYLERLHIVLTTIGVSAIIINP